MSPQLNVVSTQDAANTVQGVSRSPYMQNNNKEMPDYGTANGFLEFGAGTAGSLPFRVDQDGNVSSGGQIGGLRPSGDATGATDSAAIAAALAGSSFVQLQPGTFYLSGPLTLSTQWQILDLGGAQLQPGSAWSGDEMIAVTATGATVRNGQFYGGSGVTAGNPAAVAVSVSVIEVTLADLYFQNINDWCVQTSGQTSGGFWRNLRGVSCAAGYHINSGTGEPAGLNLVNVGNAQTGVSSGDSANLDAMLIEDSTDVMAVNLSPSVGDDTTGHSLHIVGQCAGIYVNGFDIGGFPTPTAGSGVCGLKIEENADSVSPKKVQICNGIFQTHDVGVSIGNRASDILIRNADIVGNNHDGADVSSAGFDVVLDGCFIGTSASNGLGASGTNYDVDWSGTAIGTISGCVLGSAIVAADSAGVQDSISCNFDAFQLQILDCRFIGSDSAAGNQVVNPPPVIRLPLGAGTATLTAGSATVAETKAAASTRIEVRVVSPAGTPGALYVSSVTAGTGFTIDSTSDEDTSEVEWTIYSGG